ncbi:hypothetical protein [Lapillicoccus sp.]|uniref:hypothetical protein n=1 Tax=Lapillicoccus sp. TaxID=1909287 RepID=UPI003267603F
MSETPQARPSEGAFGAPPGAPQWSPQQPAHPPQVQQQQAYPPPPQGYPQPGPPAYQQGYAGYAPPTAPFATSALVLLVVSVIAVLATGIIGIPSAVIAVLAWRLNARDLAASRKRTTTGWIVLAVNFAIAIPLLIWFYTWALSNR